MAIGVNAIALCLNITLMLPVGVTTSPESWSLWMRGCPGVTSLTVTVNAARLAGAAVALVPNHRVVVAAVTLWNVRAANVCAFCARSANDAIGLKQKPRPRRLRERGYKVTPIWEDDPVAGVPAR